MEKSLVMSQLGQWSRYHLFSSSPLYDTVIHSHPSSFSLKMENRQRLISSVDLVASRKSCTVVESNTYTETAELADIKWDNLGFGLVPTDYMYIATCSQNGTFSKGELQRYGPIELSPSSAVLNYGQGLFEGLKAYRKEDGSILLFRPEENALRMRLGAERMCMPSLSVEHFVDAVKETVLANRRWVPPVGKGSLYIRPLLLGSGPVLGLAPAPKYTFVIFVSPVGNYFKEGLAPINLIVENNFHRATLGGTGGVKTIGNYASVLLAQSKAKAQGYSDVLYLDSVNKKYLEEVSSCNIFVVKIGSCSSFSSHPASSVEPVLDSDRSNDEGVDVNWDKLGFSLVETDYMYVMKCSLDGEFSRGKLNRYGKIDLSPASGILNYGQGLYEGLKGYRKSDSRGYLLFRPQENALRMQIGAERMCMPSPTVDQFVDAVKQTVLANKRWVPPPGKGSLYIRPLLMGSGSVLGLAPAPEYTFLVYSSPVGTYFKEGLAPINLLVQDEIPRATPGGTGGIKTITNYAPVLKAQILAKSKGFTDVLYLDSVKKKHLEEASSCNVFLVKGSVIATPVPQGTILNGVTRRSIIEIARDYGYQVEERLVSIEDLIGADEVFCTGTAVVVSPVGSITFHGRRFQYKTGAESVSQRLHKTLTAIQMGLEEDKKGWTVEIN